MKLFLTYLLPYKKTLLLALILAAINQYFSMQDPVYFGKIIDYVTSYGKSTAAIEDQQYLRQIGFFVLMMIAVAMASRIAKAFQDYFTNVVIQKFGAKLYTDGIQHAMKLPFQLFEDQRSGETLSVLQKVKSDSEKFISLFINVLFISVVGMFIAMRFAYSIYPPLVPIYFLTMVGLGFLINFLSKKVKTIQKHIVSKTNALAGSTTESLRNIELVKGLGLIDQEVTRLNNNTYKILDMELEKVKKVRSLSFVQGTIINLIRQVILFTLLYLFLKDRTSIGQIMTLQFYSFFLFGPLQELGNVIISYREAQASLFNFHKLINTPIEPEPTHPVEIGSIHSFAFRKVGFSYKSSESKSLENISFDIKKGETVAFVGPSGSGKSTLVKLLIGLYEPQEGVILCNDIPITDISKVEIRNQLGIVTQDTQLFSGTIRENLLFVKPQASEQQIMEAIRASSAQNILDKTSKGLDTLIGENGMKLSGGEKQRLAIARALLRDPSLIVFDEATSALDSITEEDITETIKSISDVQQKIVILIAHRLSTIMHADKIIVLEKGQMVESGTHDELLEDKGLYYAMWRQQIGERKSSKTSAK